MCRITIAFDRRLAERVRAVLRTPDPPSRAWSRPGHPPVAPSRSLHARAPRDRALSVGRSSSAGGPLPRVRESLECDRALAALTSEPRSRAQLSGGRLRVVRTQRIGRGGTPDLDEILAVRSGATRRTASDTGPSELASCVRDLRMSACLKRYATSPESTSAARAAGLRWSSLQLVSCSATSGTGARAHAPETRPTPLALQRSWQRIEVVVRRHQRRVFRNRAAEPFPIALDDIRVVSSTNTMPSLDRAPLWQRRGRRPRFGELDSGAAPSSRFLLREGSS